MIHLTQLVDTFPSIVIPSETGGLPVEISLVAQQGHGAGNHLFAHVAARQTGHHDFVDELDEPSAKLAGTHFGLGDTTSLYSFTVGPRGHPFHRHEGHRIFTAVSGSGGCQLRFANTRSADVENDPQAFVKALHFINIPPDCLFTVRFGGGTWHQFWPLSKNSLHPVFFALSCHTDELGGNLSEELKEQVINNEASIPSLTELLPDHVDQFLRSKEFDQQVVRTTTLSLDTAAGTAQRKVCDTFRSGMGMMRGAWGSWAHSGGYVSQSDKTKTVQALAALPEHSLLRDHLADVEVDHEDTFALSIEGVDLSNHSASQVLAMLLDGFLMNAPTGVSRLMLVRNILVKPLGLRTSPLGCPVSSLLSDNVETLFMNQYPVLDQRIDQNGKHAQVILGANDKHLRFRSCVGVRVINDSEVEITLGTRVACRNKFGRFYMRAIDYVHRKYITPTMLRRASDYVVSKL